MNPKMIPLSMVLCDMVIHDSKTQKKSLIGIFSQINAEKIPVKHPHISVFLTLTEGHGRYVSELRCLRANDGKVLMRARGDLEFHDPNQIVELVFDLNGAVFPEFGEYRFEFLADDEPVISRKLRIIQASKDKKI